MRSRRAATPWQRFLDRIVGVAAVRVGLIALVLLVVVGCSTVPDAGTPPDIVGDWSGRIELPGPGLNIGIRFTDDGRGLRGTIDVPSQDISALPLGELRLDDRVVSFALPGLAGDAAFRGTLVGSGKAATIRGDYTQAGRSYVMSLSRGTVQGPARPQQPRPPFPYRSEDVTYRSGDIQLAGTLTLPQGDGPFSAVLLLTGSGAQDRDETLFGHKPFLLLADTLTRAGHAVLRVDDRGVGGSGGDLTTATYDDLVGDALAGVAYLKGRPEVDPKRIGLLGHSEGGYFAPLAAQRSHDVAFVILMSVPAVPGEEALVLQNRLLFQAAGAPPEQVKAQVEYIRELAGLLRAQDRQAAEALVRRRIEQQSTALPEAQRQTPQQIENTVRAQTGPAMRSPVTYDPGPALDALDIPVLALFGGKDLQVPPAQSEPILRQWLAGNPDVTIHTFPQLNHLMQPATTGSLDEYIRIETTISPEVLDTITQWLRVRY